MFLLPTCLSQYQKKNWKAVPVIQFFILFSRQDMHREENKVADRECSMSFTCKIYYLVKRGIL